MQHQITNKPSYHVDNTEEIKIIPKGVENLLHELKNGKTPGPDGIQKGDLLIDPITTARCLTHIFNTTLTILKLPDAWKLAYVNPLHKRGVSDQLNNYRPISMTSILCKLLEHIVLHYLNETLDSFLHNHQHGFRKGLSHKTQLCGT